MSLDRPLPVDSVVEACASEIPDRIVQIVHPHRDARRLEVEHFIFELLAVLPVPPDRELAGAGHAKVRCLVLVAESVTADYDGIGPARNDPGNVGDDDRLAKDGAAQDVADGAVGRL